MMFQVDEFVLTISLYLPFSLFLRFVLKYEEKYNIFD